MTSLLKKISVGIVALVSLLLASVLLFSSKAYAAGETYTWKDYRTITVSGGDTIGTADFILNPSIQLTGDMAGAFSGQIIRKENCHVNFIIYTYKTSSPDGYTWAPAGPLPVPPEAGSGGPPSCNERFQNYDTIMTNGSS